MLALPNVMMGPLRGALPGAMPRMASPETVTPPAGPESRTILASPLADRLAGPLLQMQQQQAAAKAAMAMRQGLQMLARTLQETNPRGAATLEQMAARLLNLFPAVRPPATPAAAHGLAATLPPVGGALPASPPPPTGMGSGPLSGLLQAS